MIEDLMIILTDLDGRPVDQTPIREANMKHILQALREFHQNEHIILTSMVDPDGVDFGGYYLEGNLHGRYHIILK